jgi:GGDEF domain-containing protein
VSGPASLLLPPEVLSSEWFRIFGLFVALNTLVYLGLTVAKFVPWPKQVTPRQVRALLGRPTTPRPAEAAPRAVHQGADPFAAARLATAARSISVALALLGVLVIGVTIANLVIINHEDPVTGVISCAFGVAALLASLTLGKHPARAHAAIWTWSILATGFVLTECWQAVHFHNPLDIADAIIAVVLIPPIALSWPAGFVASAISGGATIAAALVEYGVQAVGSTMTVLTAMGAGLILLYLRSSAIDDHTMSELGYRQHATGDPRTGLLSWEALRTLAPNVFVLAEQAGAGVHLAMVKVVELDQLEADYGETYADRVIVGVGDSLQGQCRPGELLARRASAGFALLGVGDRDVDELRAGLDAALRRDQVALGKRPIQLAVTVYKASPEVDLDGLVAELPQGSA